MGSPWAFQGTHGRKNVLAFKYIFKKTQLNIDRVCMKNCQAGETISKTKTAVLEAEEETVQMSVFMCLFKHFSVQCN